MTVMRLKRYPSPSGGFALGKMGVGATMLKQGKTAKDYVQNSLVAMWDGIENAGWGTHHNAAPIDLINGDQLTAVGSPVITDTTFDTPQGAYYYTDISAFKDAINNKDFTFEAVMRSAKSANNGIFSIGDRGLWIYGGASYNVETINILASSYTQGVTPNYSNDGVFRLVVVGGTTPKAIIDDSEYLAPYGSLASITESRCYIGGMRGIAVFSAALKSFHSIRLYSRALTASEIAANYAIDKERFNLP